MAKRDWLTTRDADDYFEDLRERLDGLHDAAPDPEANEPPPAPEPKELSWSEWFEGTGSPGKPCRHCGREGDCRCSE